MPIRLVAVKPHCLPVVTFLFDLLAERDPAFNISHRELPMFDEHRRFVESQPYRVWYVIHSNDEPIGSVYLTKNDEIGIFILKSHQGHHYGKQAVRMMMDLHPAERFLANIAPGNSRSIAMFEGIGFNMIQLTFAKESE